MKSYYQKWDKSEFHGFTPDKPHALYSPSKFHRLVNCPYSFKFDKTKGTEQKIMDATFDGTVAHKLAAYKLIYGIESNEVKRLQEEIRRSSVITTPFTTMDKDTDDYVEYIRTLIGEYSFVRVEEPLTLDGWLDGLFGTCDCFVMNPNVLTIVDFKYGLKPVKAKHNEQLLSYAVGAVIAFGFRVMPEKINLVVYQPRTKGKPVDLWSIDFETLRDEAKRIKDGLKIIDSATLDDRHAGNWCEYCENQLCPLKLQHISKLMEFETDKEFLTDEDLIEFQEKRREVTRLLNNFSDVINELYENGEILQEYRMKYSNGRKTWKNEETIKHILTENKIDAFTPLSPAKLKELIGEDEFERLHFSDEIIQTKKKIGFFSKQK